ncbi:unnamed protein product [Orchesella dallaii]|uniref:Nuclear pore complex protein Nup205 n=1 Tax=Orchesella dallaii TaxID=48710 RepID=A0ABP1S8V4_9HEXA
MDKPHQDESVTSGLPVSDVTIGSGELWFLPKELHETLEKIMREAEPTEQLIREVDRVLTRHLTDFASLFEIKPPNPVDREELKKLGKEGTYLKGLSGKQVVGYTLVNEAMLLSDLFAINEFLALDLLTVAENERENYAGWPRGLIAVTMFYEGRLWLIASLYKIIRLFPGRTWNYRLHPSILQSFQRALNSVFREDVMDRLITLLERYNLDTEFSKLESSLALGDFRHRRTVTTFLLDIRKSLANSIFCYVAQRKELRWVEVMRILDYLKEHISFPAGEQKQGKIMKDDVILITSILFITEQKLHPRDCNVEFGLSLRKYLRENEELFKCMEIWELFRLDFVINAYKVPTDSGPQSAPPTPAAGPHGDSFFSNSSSTPTAKSLLDEDSDFELTRNVFGFLQKEIFSKPELYAEDELLSEIFHSFFTDFITYMPLKINEMKYRSEEAAKTLLICQTQGINPAALESRVPEYESFLECLSEFYEHDQHELGRFYFLDNNVQFLPLSKLVRSCCMESSGMVLPAIRFLKGVSNGNPTAMFEILRQDGHNISLEHFFDSILKYANSFSGTCTQHLGFHRGVAQAPVSTSVSPMNPIEIQGFCEYLRLLQTVCAKHEGARTFLISQKAEWIRKLMEMTKMTEIPREIRASMLNTLSAIIGEELLSPDVVSTLWSMFYTSKLVDPTGMSGADLREELEEKETRLENYSLTIGMLRMMTSLVKSRFQPKEFISLEGYVAASENVDKGIILPYIYYVTDCVFLKAPYRVYKDPTEKWLMLKLSASIISILLDYIPNLMLQLLCESPLIRMLLNIISGCAVVHELSHSTGVGLHVHVDECALECLDLLHRALQRQPFYLMQRHRQEMRGGPALVGIHDIIMTIGGSSGKPDYILSILRFIDTLMTPEHRLAALKILNLIVNGHSELDSHIHAALDWQEELSAVFRHTLIETLYDQDDDEIIEELKVYVLKLLRTSVQHPAPNIGFFLLGVDRLKMDYHHENRIRTLLYALLETSAHVPQSFYTLLILLKDGRLSQATLRYLQRSHFFQNLIEEGHLEEMEFDSLCYFLKSLAIQLKSEGNASTLASSCFGKLEQVLERIEMDNQCVEMPILAIFDVPLLQQAILGCEFVDVELKTRLIRVETLEELLKEEIDKLGKSNRDRYLRSRKSLQLETNMILNFAQEVNLFRKTEGRKLLAFDGWCQVVEVLMLMSDLPMKYEFVTNVLRLLLNKALQTKSKSLNSDLFHHLAAGTVLKGTAVLKQIREGESSNQLNHRQTPLFRNLINNLAQWVSSVQSQKVRGTLYAALLYVISMLTEPTTTMVVCQESFPLILDVVAKDCCEAQETGKLQALFLMGEILRYATQRGMMATGESSSNPDPGTGYTQSEDDLNITDVDGLNSFVAGLNKTGLSSTRVEQQPQRLNPTYLDKNPTASMDSILSSVLTNGFLSSIVESFCLVDDNDLVTFLTTPQLNQTANREMRAFFVFEAKMSMLTRLSQSGYRAVRHLLDLSLIKRLMDMNVFALHNIQSEDDEFGYGYEGSDEVRRRRDAGREPPLQVLFSRNGTDFDSKSSTTSQTAFPNSNQVQTRGKEGDGTETRRTTFSLLLSGSQQNIRDSLFVQVFKLFHVMLDVASGNILILEQILQFLKRHDQAVSNCVSQRSLFHSGNNLEKNATAFLLTSLITKLSQSVPPAAAPTDLNPSPSALKMFASNSVLKLSLLNVLRIQAQRNRTNERLVKIVKNVLLFLYYHSRSKENSRGGRYGGSDKLLPPTRNVVLTNKLEMDHLLRDSEEKCSIGVIIQLVSDCALHIANSQLREKVSSVVAAFEGVDQLASDNLGLAFSSSTVFQILSEHGLVDMTNIIEVGLSLIYFHVEIFLKEFSAQRRTEARIWKQQLHDKVETSLGKQVTDACKKIPESEYIETMLLKLRRFAMGSDPAAP